MFLWCLLHSCTLLWAVKALQVGSWFQKMKSVLVFSQTCPSRTPCVGIGWHFHSLSYHKVMDITKAVLMTGINQFWLYFAGLKSNHIFFNWGGETNIESTQRISSVTTAIQTGRAAGPRRAWGANPPECHRRAEHDALQRDTLLLNSLTFPPETATASPSLPPTPVRRKTRKENPSFHVAGCVLRWLLNVDGAKLEKCGSCGSFTAREELWDIWNDTVGVAMRRIALFWFGAHCFGFCLGGFLLNCDT